MKISSNTQSIKKAATEAKPPVQLGQERAEAERKAKPLHPSV